MQVELEADYPDFDFQLVGINKAGKEAGNDLSTDGRDIPLLQDVDADGDGTSDVWSEWNVEWRDVVILDATGAKVGTFNLTKNDLAEAENYATLRQMLIDAANLGQPKPPPVSGLDLLAASDSGADPTDNRTNFNNGSSARALLVRVAGVTDGAIVRLLADGVQIGQATAASNAVVITSDGSAELPDGLHILAATQQTNGPVSDVSAPLNVTIDTTIAPITPTPPSVAAVDLLYAYNAQNSEEEEAGFVYALADAPAGATIDATTGLVNWTPTAEQVGAQHFSIVATDLAGNERSQPVDLTVTVRDFAPSSLSGFVYIDVDNDGALDPKEQLICNAEVTLAGTDFMDQPVSLTQRTAADGSYSFQDLAPGRYRIIESQPKFLADGRETIGAHGGKHPVNDEFAIELGHDVQGANYNFGERGRQAEFIGIADFFASAPRQGIVAVLSRGEGRQWHSGRGDWMDHRSVDIEWSADRSTVQVTAVGADEQSFTSTFSTHDASRIQSLGDQRGARLVHIRGPMSQLDRSQLDRSAPSSNHTAAGGVGSAEGESQATDHSSITWAAGAVLLPRQVPADRGNRAGAEIARAALAPADEASEDGFYPAPLVARQPVDTVAGRQASRAASRRDNDDSRRYELSVDAVLADDLWLESF